MARGVIELKDEERRVRFRNLPDPPVASLLRGFSAPVRLAYDLSEADLITLIAHDTDPFNRWQAAQTYATRLLLRSIENLRNGVSLPPDEAFIGALKRVIAASDADPAFAAQVLTLPGEADIAREIGENVDPDAIFAARRMLRQNIGASLGHDLRDAYRRLDRPWALFAGRARRRPPRAAQYRARSLC